MSGYAIVIINSVIECIVLAVHYGLWCIHGSVIPYLTACHLVCADIDLADNRIVHFLLRKDPAHSFYNICSDGVCFHCRGKGSVLCVRRDIVGRGYICPFLSVFHSSACTDRRDVSSHGLEP